MQGAVAGSPLSCPRNTNSSLPLVSSISSDPDPAGVQPQTPDRGYPGYLPRLSGHGQCWLAVVTVAGCRRVKADYLVTSQ